MKNIDLSKIFWSKCRAKILEKFILDFESWEKEGLHMRALARDLDEQINSIKRELDNLTELWILKSRDENKKKIFCVNSNFPLLNDFTNIFLKNYNPLDKIKLFFKDKKDLELVVVHESVKTKLTQTWKNLLDIFMIWEIDKEEFSDFLAKTFYLRKVKYAIIPTQDFFKRIEFGDKLIKNIITERWNLFIKDNLKVKERI